MPVLAGGMLAGNDPCRLGGEGLPLPADESCLTGKLLADDPRLGPNIR